MKRCTQAHRHGVTGISWPARGLAALAMVAWAIAVMASDTLHADFSRMLAAHVDKGHVNYPGIAADARLAEYLQTLDRVKADDLESREERLAYWINAYNAFAIKGILDGSSPSTFFGRIGYFKSDEYRLGGESIDLYDLERKLLVPQGEPRIHFAINCASRSCPVLRSEAYTAKTLERQLEESAEDFINDPGRNRFDRENKVAYLSMIFDWFEEDFTTDDGAVLDYVARYVNDPVLAEELRNGSYRVEHLDYDWNLNGTPTTS
jgi:hypothetical protein